MCSFCINQAPFQCCYECLVYHLRCAMLFKTDRPLLVVLVLMHLLQVSSVNWSEHTLPSKLHQHPSCAAALHLRPLDHHLLLSCSMSLLTQRVACMPACTCTLIQSLHVFNIAMQLLKPKRKLCQSTLMQSLCSKCAIQHPGLYG